MTPYQIKAANQFLDASEQLRCDRAAKHNYSTDVLAAAVTYALAQPAIADGGISPRDREVISGLNAPAPLAPVDEKEPEIYNIVAGAVRGSISIKTATAAILQVLR